MTKADNEELLPCPFCGSNKVQRGSDLYPFYIYCSNCLAKGPYEGSDNYGHKWNTRTRLSEEAARAKAETLVASVLQLPFASVNTVAYDALIDRITALLTKGI